MKRVLMCMALWCGHGVAAAQTFELSPQSTLMVHLFKDGALSALGHEHAVWATRFDGVLVLDTQDATHNRAVVNVDTSGLTLDESSARVALGLSPRTPESDRQEATDNMRGRSQLDIARFPQMRFESTSIVPNADGTYRVTGRLSIHGVSQTVSFPATVKVEGNQLVAQGSFRFKQSAFGYEPYSAVMGAIRVRDEAQMVLKLVGVARPVAP